MLEDVPSPIDLRLMHDAAAWEASALRNRPCRPLFFTAFSRTVSGLGSARLRVLELGSGPGFLAERLLQEHPQISYVALDFSPAMHELATKRLGLFRDRITFVERSFREPSCFGDLGEFQCVVTHQAVHELRHKRHHLALHQSVRRILCPGGVYLVSDHYCGPGGQSNDQLYMSVEEQRASLFEAGFDHVEPLLQTGGLVLHEAAVLCYD